MFGTVGALSCVPIIENVTTSLLVDPALGSVSSNDGPVLVLPMWNDNGSCNLRSPFVIQASEIMTFNDHLEPRHRLGALDVVGHGPSHFRHISGLLLFLPRAKMVWVQPGRYPTGNSPDVYWRPRYQGEYDSQLVAAVRSWLSSESDLPPAALELGRLMKWCEEYRVKLSKGEQKEALGFFDSESRSKRPSGFSGWVDFGTESNRMNPPAGGRSGACARPRSPAAGYAEPELFAFVTNDLGQLPLSRAHGKKGANEQVDRD
jgi:hypothetical protein